MLDNKLFSKLKKDYHDYDVDRRIMIKHSTDILRLSKQIIFSLHRGDVEQAEKTLKEAEELIKYLQTKMKKDTGLQYEGVYLAALEEYVEANMFYQFIKAGKFSDIKEFEIDEQSYIGGICDLCGELVRRAVYLATKRRDKEVAQCHETVEAIIAELIQMDLIGLMRTKFDQAKNSLRKIEEIMYDLEIKRRK